MQLDSFNKHKQSFFRRGLALISIALMAALLCMILFGCNGETGSGESGKITSIDTTKLSGVASKISDVTVSDNAVSFGVTSDIPNAPLTAFKLTRNASIKFYTDPDRKEEVEGNYLPLAPNVNVFYYTVTLSGVTSNGVLTITRDRVGINATLLSVETGGVETSVEKGSALPDFDNLLVVNLTYSYASGSTESTDRLDRSSYTIDTSQINLSVMGVYKVKVTYKYDTTLFEEFDFTVRGRSGLSVRTSALTFDYTGDTYTFEAYPTPIAAAVTYSTDSGLTYSSVRPTFTNAGSYPVYVKATLADYNTFESTFTLVINAKSIEGAVITPKETTMQYSGRGLTPGVTKVTLEDGTVLTEASGGYYVSHERNTNVCASTAEEPPLIVVTGNGNYTGVVAIPFSITKGTGVISFGSDILNLNIDNKTDIFEKITNPENKTDDDYASISINNSEQTLVFELRSGEVGSYTYTTLSGEADDALFADGGEFNIRVRAAATANYNAVERIFVLRIMTPIDGITAEPLLLEYDGENHTIVINGLEAGDQVTYSLTGELDEKNDVDTFTLSSQPQALNVGNYPIHFRVEREGYYRYVGTASIIITPVSLATAHIALSTTLPVYDGTPKEIGIEEVTLGAFTLSAQTDFDAEFTQNVNAGVGTALLTISGKGNFNGEAVTHYTINRAEGSFTAAPVQWSPYDGQAHSISARLNNSEQTFVYKVDGSPSSGLFTDVNTYKVSVSAAESTNYSAIAAREVIFTIRDVSVNPSPGVLSLSVVGETGKRSFHYGEAFDFGNISVNVLYDDGSEATIGGSALTANLENFTTMAEGSTMIRFTVTGDYRGTTASYEASVHARQQYTVTYPDAAPSHGFYKQNATLPAETTVLEGEDLTFRVWVKLPYGDYDMSVKANGDVLTKTVGGTTYRDTDIYVIHTYTLRPTSNVAITVEGVSRISATSLSAVMKDVNKDELPWNYSGNLADKANWTGSDGNPTLRITYAAGAGSVSREVTRTVLADHYSLDASAVNVTVGGNYNVAVTLDETYNNETFNIGVTIKDKASFTLSDYAIFTQTVDYYTVGSYILNDVPFASLPTTVCEGDKFGFSVTLSDKYVLVNATAIQILHNNALLSASSAVGGVYAFEISAIGTTLSIAVSNTAANFEPIVESISVTPAVLKVKAGESLASLSEIYSRLTLTVNNANGTSYDRYFNNISDMITVVPKEGQAEFSTQNDSLDTDVVYDYTVTFKSKSATFKVAVTPNGRDIFVLYAPGSYNSKATITPVAGFYPSIMPLGASEYKFTVSFATGYKKGASFAVTSEQAVITESEGVYTATLNSGLATNAALNLVIGGVEIETYAVTLGTSEQYTLTATAEMAQYLSGGAYMIPYGSEFAFNMTISAAYEGTPMYGTNYLVENDNRVTIYSAQEITVSGLTKRHYTVSFTELDSVEGKFTLTDALGETLSTEVEYGTAFAFKIVLAQGYTNSALTVTLDNSTTLTANASGVYTVGNVTSNCTVNVAGVTPNDISVGFKIKSGGSWIDYSELSGTTAKAFEEVTLSRYSYSHFFFATETDADAFANPLSAERGYKLGATDVMFYLVEYVYVYTLTFSADGLTMPSITVDNGTVSSYIQADYFKQKAGYVITGWTDGDGVAWTTSEIMSSLRNIYRSKTFTASFEPTAAIAANDQIIGSWVLDKNGVKYLIDFVSTANGCVANVLSAYDSGDRYDYGTYDVYRTTSGEYRLCAQDLGFAHPSFGDNVAMTVVSGAPTLVVDDEASTFSVNDSVTYTALVVIDSGSLSAQNVLAIESGLLLGGFDYYKESGYIYYTSLNPMVRFAATQTAHVGVNAVYRSQTVLESFTVNYDYGYDSLTDSATVNAKYPPDLPELTRSNYVFFGWKYGNEFVENYEAFFDNHGAELVPGEAITLTALWRSSSVTYTAKSYTLYEGEESMGTISLKANGTLTLSITGIEVPSRTYRYAEFTGFTVIELPSEAFGDGEGTNVRMAVGNYVDPDDGSTKFGLIAYQMEMR